jgi:aspartokinase/homoserine dehydrogenase 1
LEAVPADHLFARLAGADNIISFTTARYRERPLVIQGPGAGAEITAAGLLADILRVAGRGVQAPYTGCAHAVRADKGGA